MRSTLDELTSELGDLEALVASITPVSAALSENQDSLVRKYLHVRRRFDYAAFVVALYASFEKFIENLIAAYARLESLRLVYAELPNKLIKKHLFRTAEMLSRGRIGEGRYAGLTELEVVKNLFNCLSGVRPYMLNDAAVVAHDLNLRLGEIDALFAAIGIEQMCDRVRHADALLDWYCKTKALQTAPQDGVPAVLIEERLNDIAERRNQVAHRGGTPGNLLGVDEMRDVFGFISAFSQSVFAMVVGRYLEDQYLVSTKTFHLNQRQGDGPYKGGTVVVVEQPSKRIFLDQPLFVVTKTAGARWGRIRGIQVDGSNVDAVEPSTVATNGIGIELDFKCPKGTGLVALYDEDDVVWTPSEGTVVGSPVPPAS